MNIIPLLAGFLRYCDEEWNIAQVPENFLHRRWAMRHISHKLYFLILGAVLILAALIRFWAAPLSAGPDVAQFWAFAKVFQLYGLDFYRYADGTLDIFPFKGWAFVYPPVWLLSLRLSLLAAPASWAASMMVDTSWRLAMKVPIIAADLAIGSLIFWAVPGSKFRKLVFASLWLFHPTAWYESGVFGQFDAIAAAFLLASVVMFERKSYPFLFYSREISALMLTRFSCQGRARVINTRCVMPSVAVVLFLLTCIMSLAGRRAAFYNSIYPYWLWRHLLPLY